MSEEIFSNDVDRKRSMLPLISGILLLIAGILGIVFWIGIFTLDASTLDSVMNISELQKIDLSITSEKLVELLGICATIGIVLSLFPILGGILAIKRKLWGITLVCSILGLASMGLIFTSSIFCFVSLILLVISKQEFSMKRKEDKENLQ